ncbi:hypothetical protein B0T20DRAFT_165888 [Sordaria brevicollis]|uniref:C2H2-type domain-containing protein n=1 Tax=Sordaria brevicollis TaxID=83679 RepID=A0AAE0UCW9_SORBR|nr:hypothetical protein B0T20DRAFT_165888 [Sordaria brevicollis]
MDGDDEYDEMDDVENSEEDSDDGSDMDMDDGDDEDYEQDDSSTSSEAIYNGGSDMSVHNGDDEDYKQEDSSTSSEAVANDGSDKSADDAEFSAGQDNDGDPLPSFSSVHDGNLSSAPQNGHDVHVDNGERSVVYDGEGRLIPYFRFSEFASSPPNGHDVNVDDGEPSAGQDNNGNSSPSSHQTSTLEAGAVAEGNDTQLSRCRKCSLYIPTNEMKQHRQNVHLYSEECTEAGCDYVGKNTWRLTTHKWRVHGKKMVCPLKDCPWRGTYQTFIESHDPEHRQERKCPEQGCPYTGKAKNLQMHVKSKHKIADFTFRQAEACEKAESHQRKEGHRCPRRNCGYAGTPRNLQVHMLGTHKIAGFPINQAKACEMVDPVNTEESGEDLPNTEEDNTDVGLPTEQKHRCPRRGCPYTGTARNLQRHMRNKHGNAKFTIKQARKCEKVDSINNSEGSSENMVDAAINNSQESSELSELASDIVMDLSLEFESEVVLVSEGPGLAEDVKVEGDDVDMSSGLSEVQSDLHMRSSESRGDVSNHSNDDGLSEDEGDVDMSSGLSEDEGDADMSSESRGDVSNHSNDGLSEVQSDVDMSSESRGDVSNHSNNGLSEDEGDADMSSESRGDVSNHSNDGLSEDEGDVDMSSGLSEVQSDVDMSSESRGDVSNHSNDGLSEEDDEDEDDSQAEGMNLRGGGGGGGAAGSEDDWERNFDPHNERLSSNPFCFLCERSVTSPEDEAGDGQVGSTLLDHWLEHHPCEADMLGLGGDCGCGFGGEEMGWEDQAQAWDQTRDQGQDQAWDQTRDQTQAHPQIANLAQAYTPVQAQAHDLVEGVDVDDGDWFHDEGHSINMDDQFLA